MYSLHSRHVVFGWVARKAQIIVHNRVLSHATVIKVVPQSKRMTTLV